MADHTSAGIFGEIFVRLAKTPDERNIEFAHWLWGKSMQYDFSPCQMECQDSLVKLGLARRGVDPRWPQDGETWLYKGDEGFDDGAQA